MRRLTRLTLLAATLAAGLSPFAASALPGSSDNGDSYLNDEVRNPRYIEPGGANDPRRYRVSNPWAGYEDRQLARDGFSNEGSGTPPSRRGRVYVQPYYGQ